MPTNSAHLGVQKKQCIDPILSQAEADCLVDIYNVLGKYNKTENIILADLISDWGKWATPTFSVGFNPKTMKLLRKCDPVYFQSTNNSGIMEIRDNDNKISYNSIVPNDIGVIQKTFTRGEKNPVFILAGLGTAGTSACGYILRKNIVDLGKLYGGSAFCVFLKVKSNEGRESSRIDKVYPFPSWHRRIIFPLTYYKFMRSNLFIK